MEDSQENNGTMWCDVTSRFARF